VITVSNPPSAKVNLERVTVTDTLCAGVNSPTNFTACPGVGTGSVVGNVITWPSFNLPIGGSCTIAFDVTVASCDAACENIAHVVGYCVNAPAEARFACSTPPCSPLKCWLTGGGQSIDNGGAGALHSYGGVINPGCSPTAAGGGNWSDRNQSTGVHFKGVDITVIRCGNVVVPGQGTGSRSPKTAVNYILFKGTGYVTGVGGNGKRTDVAFFGFYEDRHEPASLGQPNLDFRDRYYLQVNRASDVTVLSNGHFVFSGTPVVLVDVDGTGFVGDVDNLPEPPDGVLDPVIILHGNLQIHQTGCDKFAPIALPALEPVQDENVALPTEVSFGAPRPNPTGGNTELTYALPKEALVSAKVFDVAGRVVRDFGAAPVAAGWHALSWDLANASGQRVGPGLYFVRLSVDGRTMMRHVTVLR